MPIYEAELHDGRKVTLESDHPPTEDEILAAAGQWEKENTPGAAGTFARSAATSIVPGLGTAGGAAMGAELGAAGGPIGILAGGAIGALVGGIAAYRAQRKLLKIAVPDFLADTERGAAAHPGAAFAGDVAGALPVFEFNPTAAIRGAVSIPAVLRGTATTAQQKLAKAAAIQTGMGVGFGVVNPLLEGQAPTGTGVAESAGMALLLGHPRAKMFRPTVPQFLRKGAPDASSQQEAAKVHGDVSAFKPTTGEVSFEIGGERVQPQTQGVAQETQVPLTEEQRVPRITGNEEGGFTLELHGKKESGFQTEAEAKMAALQVIAGEREMQDEGKPMSREALKEKDKQRAKSKEQQEADEIFDEAIETANNAANELGKKTQIVDEDKYGGEVPFAPGEFMKPAGDTVLISKQQFRTWLIKEVLEGGASRKRIMESVARRINEEHEHQRVINALGDQVNQKMSDYWNSMTGFEKGVTNLQYHGDWKGNPKYTPALMGHEAVRQRLQRLSGTTSEITQAVGLERWSLKTLNVLSDMVRFARERVGTEASAKQREVWDHLQKNLDLAMKMVQGPPAAKRRKGMSVAEELKANLEAAKKHAEFIANQYAVNAQEKQQVRDNLIKAWKDAIFYHVTGKAPPKEGPPDQQTPAAKRRSIEDEIREGPPMAPQPGDYEKYQQLQQQLREYNSRKEWPPPQLFKEIETIKNRNGGMPPRGETPLAKMRHNALRKMPPMDEDLREAVIMGAEKGTRTSPEVLAMGYQPNLYTAITDLATRDPREWGISPKNTQRLLDWFKTADESGYSREAILEDSIRFARSYASGLQKDLENLDREKRMISGAEKNKAREMWLNDINRRKQQTERDLQGALDSIPYYRERLERITGKREAEVVDRPRQEEDQFKRQWLVDEIARIKEQMPQYGDPRREAWQGTLRRYESQLEDIDRRNAGLDLSKPWVEPPKSPGDHPELPFAKRRKKPEHFEQLPIDIGMQVWNAYAKYRKLDPQKEFSPDRLWDVMQGLAIKPESEWPLPEGLKDQVQKWFKDQIGGRLDRTKMITREIDSLRRSPSWDEEHLEWQNKQLDKLLELRSKVYRSEKSAPEDYVPAAKGRGDKQAWDERVRAMNTLYAHEKELLKLVAPEDVAGPVEDYQVEEFFNTDFSAQGPFRDYFEDHGFEATLRRIIGRYGVDPDKAREWLGKYKELLAAYDSAVDATMDDGERSFPAAKMRKKPQQYDPDQLKMFSSEMTAKGIPGAEDVPLEERTTATQAGAPSALEASLPIKRMEEVYKEVAKPKPSFRAFTDWFYKNSTATRAEMARDWENAVWHHLLSADGARLQELRKNYQLESRLGSRDIADRPDKLSPQQTLELKSSGTAIGREDFRKAGVAAQKYRYKVISELATRMINQARDRAKALTRKEVTLDDVDFTNARAETGAYHVFSKEGDSEQVIRRVLTNRARPSKFDKLSVTKRLAVLIDDAGKVHVVDVYNSNAEPTKRSLELPSDLKPRGIDGLMVYDPQGTTVRGRPHVSLKTALEKNRLYASILIDDPVKDFHQVYDSLRDFEERFGQEAASRETIAEQDFATQGWNPDAEGIDEEVDEIRSAPEGMSAEEYEAGETPPKMSPPRAQEVQDVEAAEEPPSSQVMRGEGGSVTGPSAGAARASMGSMRRGGELERSRYMPMTTPEALAVHSQFVEEIGQLNSPEDIENLITGFIDLHKRGQLRGQQRQALSAITKAAQHYADELYEARGKLTSKDPNYESDERITELAYEKALDHFYEAARISKDRNQYLQIALQPFSKGTLESLPPQVTPETRYSPVRRPELVRATRYGDVRRLEPYNPERISQEFIGPTRAPELTTGNPGVIPGPEKLPNSVLEAISQKPLVDEKGRVIEPKSSEAVGIDITKTKPTGKVSEFPPPEFRTESGFLGPRKAKMPKFGGKGQGDFELPAARVRRTTESLSDDLAKIKNAIVNFHKRQGSFRDLNSLADGANRSSEEAAIKQSNDIRLASLDKEVATLMESHGLKDLFDRPEAKQVRRAVKAFLAAFQDAEDREWLRISDEWHDIRARAAEAKRKHEKWELDPKDVPVWTKPTDVTALNFEKMILNADKGIAKAKDMLKSPNRETRKVGEKYLAGAEELKADAIWARDNLNSEPLRRTVKMYQDVMQEHLENLLMNGFNIASRDYYVPGRYDGEMWDDGMFTWGDMRVLGGQQRMPKVFRNYYEAIATGPYIPVNGDIAALAQHSIATGMRMINERAWLESTKTMIDPVSKKPIGISPVAAKVGVMVENPETGIMEKQSTLEWQVPAKHQDYELVYPSGRKSVPIAIRRGYVQAVKGVLAQSEVPNMPGGKELLRIAQMLKHGVILLLDTFHPGRLLQYGASLGGKEWTNVGRRGAWSALNFNPESLPDAVKRGLISQEAADWAMTKVKVRDGGRLREITRHQLASEFLHNGLNATQIADVFYRNAIQKIPVIGERWHQLINPINRWTFDRITPGLIMENAILSLERINKSSPNRRLDAQMRDIARDINAYFGNMGRQGLFKNPTFRDLSQIFVLAPMWQEGLFRKEITALSRVSGLSWALGRRGMGSQAYFGPIGYGIAKGLASYFVLTQAINLITRRKFTWDNPEDDHKMDAWFTLPWMGEGKGVWVSPFSVFGEVGHDFMRLYETKGTTFAALTRLGENKLGPWGRVAGIIHDSKTPSGQQITSDVGMGKAIAGELGPLPISLAPPIRGLAHAVAPGAVAPNRPNVPMQRALSMVGIKTMTPTRPEQDIARMAAKFTKDNNLKFEPMVFTPTDEASYSKLRGAIRNEDWSGAQKLLADLRKHRTDQQIIHAMKLASQRPFTGSKQAEKLFLYSLSNRELDMYYAANLDRADQYQKFVDFFLR